MLEFLCKWKCLCQYQSLTKISKCEAFHEFQSLKSICTATGIDGSRNPFTVTYLKNLCGLSGKSLISASKLVSFDSSEKPNSVLEFFSDLGLSQTQVSKMIFRHPQILVSDTQKTIQPKIDFLISIGFSEVDVNKIIVSDPGLLVSSLENHLVPSFDFIKNSVCHGQKALSLIKRYPRILHANISKFWGQNAVKLETLGVPKSQLFKLITWYPRMSTYGPHRLNSIVLTVKEMGFNPCSSAFLNAVKAMTNVSDLTWEGKLEIYRSLGFSNDEIHSMFKKEPTCMCYSEEKIREAVEFYVNKLHLSPSKLSAWPMLIKYSLKKRVIPRCSVLQVLWSRSMITESPMLTSLVVMSEKDFLQKYVVKYEEEVLEVLAAYQGKLKFDKYSFDSGEPSELIAK